MLDFTHLRSQVDGQRGAFEGLICQLGKANPPSGARVFRKIDGSGGDGGLEAYWVLKDGAERGYQAKFHTRSGDIDWDTLDKSVAAALKSHPLLSHLQIAIACDLTDEVPGRKGMSGRAYWDVHHAKWETLARELGRTVTFEFWGASHIEQLLTQPSAIGLREYWFGEVELDRTWFVKQFERTSAALEERYSPEDHVDVAIRRLFEGLQRGQGWRHALSERLAAVVDGRPLGKPQDLTGELAKQLETVGRAVDGLSDRASDLELSADREFPTTNWLVLSETLRERVQSWEQMLSDADESLVAKDAKQRALNNTWQLDQAIAELQNYLSEPMHRSDSTRFVIFEGAAGAGKSHLLAAEVARSIAEEEPAIMLLGTDFTGHQPVGQQICTLLGLKQSFDVFLGALSAVAEQKNTRALLVIDAINEGSGAQGWRDELSVLAAQVGKHKSLALVVSCRSEYAQYLVTEGVRSRAVVAEVFGFVTAAEQEAAAEVYMDRRGILRPATPWLSPEFTNPLFLRTTCLALERDGRDHYPTGLRGVKETLSFYLEATGRHLGTTYDGSSELVGPLKQAVVSMAKAMAGKKTDFVSRVDANRLIDDPFDGFSRVAGRSWLDILRLRGIVRVDPDPDFESNDPLEVPKDVIRFAFQRFQDHLVAEQLLGSATVSAAAFLPGGELGFLLGKYGLQYGWAGVFQALWSLVAENQKQELLDLLPDPDRFWRSYDAQLAFTESVYWRPADAFNDRTLDLLNRLGSSREEKLDILLKLSVLDHPWNAELLDRNLAGRKLADRDAFWTIALNNLATLNDGPSAPERIVSWCLGPSITRATPKTLELALLTLGWIFSTTNRALRDRATKAATEVLLLRPDLLPRFVERFAGVNDPYIVERVLAACAGACLRNPSPKNLAAAANAVFEAIFRHGTPPAHLLTRDYGRLIVELAEDAKVAGPNIDLMLCRPPYGSPAPRLPANDKAVKLRSEAAGAGTILSSCSGFGGDFGRYVVESRMGRWSNVRLTRPAPEKRPAGSRGTKRSDKIRVDGAKLWVADRAISLGWSKEKFPRDGSGDDRLRGSRVERIGKKYQWIAYFELLARLADNYWLIDDYSEPYARPFDTPVDTEFVRDIDPTVPPDGRLSIVPLKTQPQQIALETVAVDQQKAWVFAPHLAKERLALGLAPDLEPGWLSLYRYSSAGVDWPKPKQAYRLASRQDDFHFIMMLAIPARERQAMITRTKARQVDFHEWLPPDHTDSGYVYELGRRATWPSERQREVGWPPAGFTMTGLTQGYHWESHLDGSLPEGASVQLPAAWLIKELKLQADPNRVGSFVDANGAPVIVANRAARNSWCIARQDRILGLLEQQGLVPMWVGIGERSGYPDPTLDMMARVRWNGLMWLTKAGPRSETWDERHDINRSL